METSTSGGSMTPNRPSLNRTMQYGNRYRANSFFPGLRSLNRTMQYGNQSTSLKQNMLCWFKSYYVVWKLPMTVAQKAAWHESLNRTMQYGNGKKIAEEVAKKLV